MAAREDSLGPWDRALGVLALLSLGWAVLSVVVPPPRPTYARLKADQAARRAAFEREIARLQGRHPWAGKYVSDDELWVGPAGVERKVSSRMFIAGSVTDLGTRLRLSFPDPDHVPRPGDVVDYRLVPWGRRLYLVPVSLVGKFVDAVNAGFEPRRVREGLFYLRDGDWLLPASGKPLLPADEARRLLPAPIDARVARVERAGRASQSYLERTRLTLDAGRAAGVRPGVVFYLIKDDVAALEKLDFTIDSVSEHASTAVFETYKGDSPRPGWRVSTLYHRPKTVGTLGVCGGVMPSWPTDWMLADGYGQ